MTIPFFLLPIRRGITLAVVGFMMTWTHAQADGGRVQLQQVAGPFRVTVFTTPAELEPGPADLSVLVQRADSGEVLLDAVVDLVLRAPAGVALPVGDPFCGPGGGTLMTRNPESKPEQHVIRASRERATNKLLQSAWLELPVSGVWPMRLVLSQGGEGVEIPFELNVVPGRRRNVPVATCLALPPVFILLFAARQKLLTRRSHATPS